VFGQAALVQHWDLNDVDAHAPAVLHSRDGEGRVVLIALRAGDELGEHEVREAALVLVVDGKARIESGSDFIDAGPGGLFRFDPHERHTVTALGGARLLLVLAPWPGEGHYAEDDTVRASA
jgi:quercetin dioxygenase-like cupin family protein